MDVLKSCGSWFKGLLMLLHFVVFIYFFFIFYCKTDKTHYSVKKCVFFSFSGGIRGFFILTRDQFSEKSARCHYRLKVTARTQPYGEFRQGDATICSITLLLLIVKIKKLESAATQHGQQRRGKEGTHDSRRQRERKNWLFGGGRFWKVIRK